MTYDPNDDGKKFGGEKREERKLVKNIISLFSYLVTKMLTKKRLSQERKVILFEMSCSMRKSDKELEKGGERERKKEKEKRSIRYESN